MKKFISFVLTLCLVISLPGLLTGTMFLFLAAVSDDRADKSEIFEFVREKEEELLEAIESSDFSNFENQGFIKDIIPESWVVEFYCGGAGFGSGTSYVGFYYSPNNSLTAAWCAPPSAASLIPSGDGFRWQEPDGDNQYYTEHICGNFYYYEASF